MPRIPRFTINDGFYHVLCRGHNKRDIFHTANDFLKYLKLLWEAKITYDLKIYHYTLMSNHIHLILNLAKGEDLCKAMSFLNQQYAQYYRAKYGGCGYVWQGRFKSFLIQRKIYLIRCGRYVELNSVIAGIVRAPENYRWSSCGVYIGDKKSNLVDIDPEYAALSECPVERKKIYSEYLRDGLQEKRSLERYFRAGAYGDKIFVEKLKKNGLRQRSWHPGRPKK